MKINQSLSALGNCINALSSQAASKSRGPGKGIHIPYRDSKLTHILKEALGGNSKTTLLIACSPHISNLEETVSTLRFGQRAKTIKTKVTAQIHRSMEELNAIIQQLQKEVAFLRNYVRTLEETLQAKEPSIRLDMLKSRSTSVRHLSQCSQTEFQAQQEGESDSDSQEGEAEALEVAELWAALKSLKAKAEDSELLSKEKLQEAAEYGCSFLPCYF